MKTLANRLIMLAVSAAGIGMAYGQTQMKAEIPFSFRIATRTLPPGEYLIYRQSLGVMTSMVLENIASHYTVYAVGGYVDSYERFSHPSAVFSCVYGGCSLSAIKTDNGTLNYARHKAVREQSSQVSVVSIPLKSAKGE